MDNTIRLRCDLTQAVANKMNEFETKYKHILFFGAMYEENADSLMYFQKIKFTPDNDNLVMNAELEKDFFDTFTDKELNEVKDVALDIQRHDLIEQMSKIIKTNKTEKKDNKIDKAVEKQISNIIDNIVKENFELRKITVEEQECLKQIKENMYEKLNLDMEIMTTDLGFGLQIITDCLILNGRQLRVLVKLLHDFFDFLSIKTAKIKNENKIILTLGTALDKQ